MISAGPAVNTHSIMTTPHSYLKGHHHGQQH
nr:MAG TPA: hypothetical protein [Caudoviricetes sp.]